MPNASSTAAMAGRVSLLGMTAYRPELHHQCHEHAGVTAEARVPTSRVATAMDLRDPHRGVQSERGSLDRDGLDSILPVHRFE